MEVHLLKFLQFMARAQIFLHDQRWCVEGLCTFRPYPPGEGHKYPKMQEGLGQLGVK